MTACRKKVMTSQCLKLMKLTKVTLIKLVIFIGSIYMSGCKMALWVQIHFHRKKLYTSLSLNER